MRPLLIALVVLSALAGHSQEWTRFRGPNGTGLSDAKTIPTKWTASDINWKVALPGEGHSSPVLWGDRIFITSHDASASQFVVLCIDTTDGRVLWQQANSLRVHDKHRLNSFATATPAVDADRVYVCRTEPARITFTAFDHAGQTVWEKNLGPFGINHGAGASPIVHGDLVVFPNEHRGVSFLIAMEASTGQERWRVPRTSDAGNYSTPCVYQPERGESALIFNSQAHGISAIAPDTGDILWEFRDAFDKRSVSSPVIAGDLVIGSCGSGGGGNYVVAVRAGDPARNRAPSLAYQVRRSAPYVPTSICVGDALYLWSDGGVVSRVNTATGEVHWQERVEVDFYGSPVCVDGRLFCVSTTGEVVVVRAGEQFEVLARNPLSETTHSTPAVAGGRMYIHTSGHLISVGGKNPPSAGDS
jgi:outer membrane protein assembly factor BamB